MPDPRIDQIMEQASAKLAETDYLACETLCLEALQRARDAEDYERYARVLLPLQEARRQRRQIAADAGVIVLTGEHLSPERILDEHTQGCLLLTAPPYDHADEQAIRETARTRGFYIEALVLDSDGLRQCFEDQAEREGDAALAAVDAKADRLKQLDALEQALHRVGDHEIAHQRLAAVARQAAREKKTDNV